MNYFNFNENFEKNTPFWHLCTNGNETQILFHSDEDYKYALNALALIACHYPKVKILTFILMSNHIHLVLSGKEEDCLAMFEAFKWKLCRGLNKKAINWKPFQAKMIPIKDENYLKTVIAYVNRNAFVINPKLTPFNYPWGAGREFFKYNDNAHTKSIQDLSIREKRIILHTRIFHENSNKLRFCGDMADITSFCHIDLAEKMFNNARDYTNWFLTKVEKFSSIASTLADDIVITDDELNKVIFYLLKTQYKTDDVDTLCPNDKINLALDLRKKYNAKKNKLRRLLNLDNKILTQIFPEDQ